jgi:hypothetical protein
LFLKRTEAEPPSILSKVVLDEKPHLCKTAAVSLSLTTTKRGDEKSVASAEVCGQCELYSEFQNN